MFCTTTQVSFLASANESWQPDGVSPMPLSADYGQRHIL